MPWYALQTDTSFEQSVESRLIRAGVEAWWPSYSKIVTHARKKESVQRSLFPGYVLADFDGRLCGDYGPHIIRVVGYGVQPIPILAAQVEAIRIMSQSSTVEPQPYAPASGDLVRIIRGPLAGIGLATVIRLKGTLRVVLSVPSLARAISAEIDADCLELVRRAA